MSTTSKSGTASLQDGVEITVPEAFDPPELDTEDYQYHDANWSLERRGEYRTLSKHARLPKKAKGMRVVVVMPAYNAEKTLERTHREVTSHDCVDAVIVVDDQSSDRTAEIGSLLHRTTVISHQKNKGYGGNQKTCYRAAMDKGADIVVMVHPDYQYTPLILPAMVSMIESGLYDCVLGSRILGGHAVEGGMPMWRYVANRFLTLTQNLILGEKLSEYHTGYRAFSRKVLETLPLDENSDDFVFDNQMLTQVLWCNLKIAEVSCPTRYAADASSINFKRSVQYGFGCIGTALQARLARHGIIRSSRFPTSLR